VHLTCPTQKYYTALNVKRTVNKNTRGSLAQYSQPIRPVLQTQITPTKMDYTCNGHGHSQKF